MVGKETRSKSVNCCKARLGVKGNIDCCDPATSSTGNSLLLPFGVGVGFAHPHHFRRHGSYLGKAERLLK